MRLPSWRAVGTLALTPAIGVSTLAAAPAQAADPAGWDQVKITEIRSNGGADFVEIRNTGTGSVDISGWKVVDADPAHVAVPFATSKALAAGEYFSFETDTPALTGGFGLGAADSATIFTADGTQVDTQSWTSHRTPSWSLCDGTFVTVQTATPGAANACPAPPAEPAWKSVKINEVESNGDKVADWVELVNNGTTAVDVSGWKILDNDPDHVATPVVVPANTSIAAGGHYAIYTEVGQTPGFGLGAADSATLLLPDGTTQVDTYAWTAHAATTYGRCPDGTGAFTTTTVSTRGASNACSPIRINEVESKDPDGGHDWVELVNISGTAVPIGGWVLKDNGDADAFTVPAGTSVPANGHLVLDTFAFGLGGSDAARLFDGSTLVDAFTWTSEAATTYGRCKDGVGDFTTTVSATKGEANACPGLTTAPWDGSQTIRTADAANTWGADLSGLAFDPKDPDVLWGAQNKRGTLWKLVRNGQTWTPAPGWTAGKDPKYTDGTGAPDTEGITVGPDGFLYAASERNNSASGVSRMSVLRYDPSSTAASLTATNEWDVTAAVNEAAGTTATPIGANLGLEGVTFVPDSFLTANGFRDQTRNTVYDPADYAGHGSGLFVVAVEDTGHLYAFALDQGGSSSKLVADIATGLPKLADVTFDPERQRLWAVADDTVDGQTSLLKLVDGAFVLGEAYDRPAGMANLNNEGFALAAQSQCADGSKEVVWSDDGNTDSHSLRTGTIHCTAPPAVLTDPTITAKVEGTKAASGWYRSAVTVSFTCEVGSAPLTGDCPSDVVLSTSGEDQSVERTITATDGGTATATVSDLDVDLVAPAVKITGVTKGALYAATPPTPRCVGTDALSGLASCTVAKKVGATSTTVTATATDEAGNTATATTSYKTLAFRIVGATYASGAFNVTRGQAYHVAATAGASAKVSAPYRTKVTSWTRTVDGKARIRVPASAVRGTAWKVKVWSGTATYVLVLRITR